MNFLMVCSQNLQRSPTAAHVFRELAEEEGLDAEVKSAGTAYTAETQVNSTMIEWADHIYVMKPHHKQRILAIAPDSEEKMEVLGIDDVYFRGDDELVSMLEKEFKEEIKKIKSR